jgi:hypothetical protein
MLLFYQWRWHTVRLKNRKEKREKGKNEKIRERE